MSNKEITRVPEILPDNLAAESADFVTFLKKYYEWMGQDGNPSADIDRSLTQRTLDNAVDFYLSSLYNELGYGFVLNKEANQENLINNLAEIYSAKGSLQSIKVMFRALFGEEIDIKLPKEQIFKSSSGNWLSEYSVIATLNQGDPYTMVGKYVEVETSFPNTPTQTFDVEVKRVEQREEGTDVYEIYVSRYFAGFFYFDSVIEYGDVKLTLKPSMSQVLNIEKSGTGFRVGETFPVNDFVRATGFNTQAKLPTVFKRRVFSRSGLRRIDIEDVDTDVRSDGTITQTIKLGDVVTTRIIRGTTAITRVERGGQVKEFKEILEGIPVPNLAINWDAISSALTELAGFDGLDGTVSIFLYDFLKDTPTATYVDGSTDPLFDTTPGATQYARGDFDRDGTLSIDDATSVIKYLFDIDPTLHAGDSDRYDRITDVIAAWNAYTTANSLTEYVFDLRVPNTSGNAWDPMYSLPIDVGVDLLRLSVDAGALSLSAQTTQINENAANTGFKKGDIDNDGAIDTDDIIAILKYQDPALRSTLPQTQQDWIALYLDTGSVSDLDLIVSAMALDFQTNKRNTLHDFLLQVDGDYATGRVRGDINQNGRITLDDVTLLLRRASGYYDLSKGGIEKLEVTDLVGGYKEGSGTISLANFGDGNGAVISPVIRDGVITEFDTVSAGKGLRKAIGIIQVLPESHITNVPDDWRFITFAQGISYYEIELTIANGKIQGLSAPGIMYNFPENPVEAIQPTWDEARIQPTISGGAITGFQVLFGGTGYDLSTATIVVEDVEGSGLVMPTNPVGVRDGVIEKINITDGGQNYNQATTSITVTSSGGSNANLTPIVTNGVLTGVTIVDGGEGYDPSTDTIAVTDTGTGAGANIGSFEVIDGIVDAISAPSNGGSNFTANAKAYIRRGDSAAATPKIETIVQDGVITEVVVDRQGINYPSTTTATNSFQRHEPTLKATLNSSGGITGIVAFDSLDNEASKSLCGWQTATITVTDLAAEAETSPGAGDAIGGTGASITVDIDDGKISGFVIGASGSGYIEPQVTITGTRLNSTITVHNTPDYVEWIDEVIGEPLLGSIYNPLLVDGPGVGATARVTKVGSNGELEEIKLTSFGFDYPDVFTSAVAPENTSGTPAQITFRSGVVGITSPSYVDRKGFLSDIIKIQDNDLYQEFSYVVQTGVDFDIFEDLIKKSVHPAGMKIFGEQSINSFFSLGVQQFDVTSFFYTRQLFDRTDNGELGGGGDGTSTRNEDDDVFHMEKDLPRVEDPTDSTADADHLKETYEFSKDMGSNTIHGQVVDAESEKEIYHMEKDMGAGTIHVQIADAQSGKETYFMEKDLPRVEDPTDSTADAESEKEVYHMEKDMGDGTIHEQVADAQSGKETYHMTKPVDEDFVDPTSEKETYFMVKAREDSVDPTSEKETYFMDKDLPRLEDPTDSTADAEDGKEVYHMVKARTDNVDPTSEKETYHMGKSVDEDFVDPTSEKETYLLEKDLTVEDHANANFAYALSNKEIYLLDKDLPRAEDPTDSTADAEDSEVIKTIKDFPPATDLLLFTVDATDSDTLSFTKGLTDNADPSESEAFLLFKNFADTADVEDDFSLADEDIYHFVKRVTDTADAEESIGDFEITKALTDPVDVDFDRSDIGILYVKSQITESVDIDDPTDQFLLQIGRELPISAARTSINTNLPTDGSDLDFIFTKDSLTDSTDIDENDEVFSQLFSKGNITDTADASEATADPDLLFTKSLAETSLEISPLAPKTIEVIFRASQRSASFVNPYEAILRLRENPITSLDVDLWLDDNSELNDNTRDRSRDSRASTYRPSSDATAVPGYFRGGSAGSTVNYSGGNNGVYSDVRSAVIVAYVGDTVKFEFKYLNGLDYVVPSNGYWLKTSKTADTTTDVVSTGVTNQGMTSNYNSTLNATMSGVLTWDTSAATPGDYYLMGGGTSQNGATNKQDNSWIHVVLLSMPERIDVDILTSKPLQDVINNISDGDSDNFSLTKVLADSTDVTDVTSLVDSDIYSINKGIQDQVSNVDNGDSGSVVLTRNYAAIGYIANGLDYEYSSETSEVTF